MAHHKMRLSGDEDGHNCQRPLLSVWFDPSDPDTDCVTLCVGAAWGAAQRFVALSPEEARQLAKLLVKAASEAQAAELAQLICPPDDIDPNLQYPGKTDAIGPFPEETA